MDPTWPFLLMFESRVKRHSFVALRHSMTTCIPRVDGFSTGPPGRGVTWPRRKLHQNVGKRRP